MHKKQKKIQRFETKALLRIILIPTLIKSVITIGIVIYMIKNEIYLY